MLQLSTRYLKANFCFLSRTIQSLFNCVLSARLLSEETYHKLQTCNGFICLPSFFNHNQVLPTPSKPNWHKSPNTFQDCHVSIVRTAIENSEKFKALIQRCSSLRCKGSTRPHLGPKTFCMHSGLSASQVLMDLTPSVPLLSHYRAAGGGDLSFWY